ncbi:MAG TPA: hypothetical protein PKK12_06755 [Candidatus Aminicenantes bacterium]|nr:hypothetical protein [Candidatus Aminicenantes bacterium]
MVKAGRWADVAQAAERAGKLATQFANPDLPQFVRHAQKIRDRRAQETASAK